eukprot:scaffold269_cov404-Prasinococcus_capsulatus_cf.AAC.23
MGGQQRPPGMVKLCPSGAGIAAVGRPSATIPSTRQVPSGSMVLTASIWGALSEGSKHPAIHVNAARP